MSLQGGKRAPFDRALCHGLDSGCISSGIFQRPFQHTRRLVSVFLFLKLQSLFVLDWWWSNEQNVRVLTMRVLCSDSVNESFQIFVEAFDWNVMMGTLLFDGGIIGSKENENKRLVTDKVFHG